MKPRPQSSNFRKPSKNGIGNVSPEELYSIAQRKNDWGIEGYEVPRQYYDYHQVMWKKKVAYIAKKCPRNWPPKDWPKDKDDPDKQVPPKRPNYLDDVYKWCNSYYSKERAEAILEDKPIEEPKSIKPLKDNKRSEFLKNFKEKTERQKNKRFYFEEKEDMIDEIKEKAEEDCKLKEISYENRMKAKYKEGRCQTARCDRITTVAEAEFVGEEIPFYNTAYNEDKEKSKQKLFYPDKTCTWKRAPAWKWNTMKKPNEQLALKEQNFQEKNEEYMAERELTAKDLWVDVRKSYHLVTHHGELQMKIYPKTQVKEEEHYIQAREENPVIQIGPQQYWKMPKAPKGVVNPKKLNFSRLEALAPMEDDKGNKIYYMDRRKTDKRVYTAGMRKSVY